MIRFLLIIALLYVALIYFPRRVMRGFSGPSQSPKPRKSGGETTVTRIEEPKKKVLDPSDAEYADFEEVDN